MSVRILVLEDDVSLRGVLEQVLRARGFEVVVSSRGEEALARARGEKFDLIVADIRMEGMNGLDTIEKTQELQPDIGSIVVSGFASEEETLRAVKLKVAGYLKKPFSIDALLDLINKHLAQRGERLKAEREKDDLRRSLLWSLDRQSRLVERLYPGTLLQAGDTAARIAARAGFSGTLPEQFRLATLLGCMVELGELEPPERLAASLSPYPILLSSLESGELPEVCRFALAATRAGADFDPTQGPWDRRLVEAYGQGAEEGPEIAEEERSVSGLLNLATTLEHSGDWEGARRAYREVTALHPISPQAIRAKLGEARLAHRRGQTPHLEEAIRQILEIAAKLGPVTLALSEMEAAFVLRRAAHPAAEKLLRRASLSLDSVGLSFAKARVQLLLEQNGTDHSLAQSWAVLLATEHRWELLEQVDEILPDLLEALKEREIPEIEQAVTSLLAEHSQSLLPLLRAQALSEKARNSLVRLLGQQKHTISQSIIESLTQDPNPQIREQAERLSRAGTTGTVTSTLRVYSMGTLQISLDGKALDSKELKTQKTRFLLARLLGSPSRALSVDRLMEEFWPDSGPSAKNNLNTAVSLIRRFLTADHTCIDPVTRLGESLSLNPQLRLWHDVDELESADESASRALVQGEVAVALNHFRRVVRLYRGPFLESCYMDWALERRTRLEMILIRALRALVENLFQQRRFAETLEYGVRLLSILPEDLESHQAMMRSYLALEQSDRATDHFENYDRSLRSEGLEPDLELVRLYQMAKYGLREEPGLKL